MTRRCLHASSGCTNEPEEDRTLCERCASEVIVSTRDVYHERLRAEGKATASKGAKQKGRTE